MRDAKYWVAGILFVSFAIKLVPLLTTNPTLIADEQEYFAKAQILAEQGVILGTYRPPLYILFLGLPASLVHDNVAVLKLFNVVISTLSVLVFYGFARIDFGKATSITAAAMFSVYPNLVAFSSFLWSESLFILVFLVFCYFLFRSVREKRIGLLVMAGLMLGVASLTRSSIFFFVFPAMVWLFVVLGDARTAWKWSATLLFFCVLTISPWTVRNFAETGRFVFIDSTSGKNLWTGNNPYLYDDRLARVPEFPFTRMTRSGKEAFVLACNQEDRVVRDRCLMRKGAEYIAAEPRKFASRGIQKLELLWSWDSFLLRNIRLGAYPEMTPTANRLLVPLVHYSYLFVMLTGGIGWILSKRNDLRSFTLLVVAYYCVIHFTTFGLSRFRLPLMPFFVLFSAWTLARLATMRRRPARLTA